MKPDGLDPALVPSQEQMLGRLEGDLELLRVLADPWIGQVDELVSAAERGIAEGDADGLRRAAHTLKGAAGVFSANEVVDRALKLEVASADAVPDDAAAMLADLVAACEGLTWALQQLIDGDG